MKRVLRMWMIVVFMLGAAPAFGQAFEVNQEQLQREVIGRVQRTVIVPNEEWVVIQPKLWRIVCLQVQGGQTHGIDVEDIAEEIFGRRGARQQPALRVLSLAFNGGQPMRLLEGRQELIGMLQTQPDAEVQLAGKLAEIRSESRRLKQELVQAQLDLQRILTLRQEAIMIQLGYLE